MWKKSFYVFKFEFLLSRLIVVINKNKTDTKDETEMKKMEKSDSGIFLKYYLAIKNKNGLCQWKEL